MNDHVNSMGPRAGNRPPVRCLPQTSTARQDPLAAAPIDFTLAWNTDVGQEFEQNVASVADHEGRDRSVRGSATRPKE
jgi:hypothetical protein